MKTKLLVIYVEGVSVVILMSNVDPRTVRITGLKAARHHVLGAAGIGLCNHFNTKTRRSANVVSMTAQSHTQSSR